MSGETFKRGGRYSIIPAVALYSGKLNATDIHVLAAIGHHTDQAGWCHFNQRSLAEAIGIARETVNRCIKKLTDAGFLEHRDINAGKRGPRLRSIHRYRVLMDALGEPELDSEYDATSRCDDDVTTQDIVVDVSEKTDCVVRFGNNRGDGASTAVVTAPSQHNDLLRTTPLEREESASPSSRRRQGRLFGRNADQQTEEAAVQAMRDADRVDFEAFRQYAIDMELKAVPENLTPGRRDMLRAIRNKYGPDAWQKAVANLRASPYWHGRMPIDTLATEKWFVKMLEGNFLPDQKAVASAGKVENVSHELWESRVRVWLRKKLEPDGGLPWPQSWGPPPWERKCIVPEDIVAKYKLADAA
jgi:biotin operon repressor